MMARGHAHADRRRHDAGRAGGGSSSRRTSSASRSTAAAIRTASRRTRSWPRSSASSRRIGVPVVADLRLRAVSESARRGELRAAPARRRADRRGRARQPERRQQRLRSRHLPRGGSLRRRGHAVEHDAARVAPPDEDHQHPEHEGPWRHRRHRVPEEHRLRQLLQRRAHAPARQVAHLLRRRHAGRRSSRCDPGRCSRSWTACAACGTAVRSRERRATSSIRGRSCSAPIRWRSIACCSTSSTKSARAKARSRSGTARRASLKIDDTRARDADPNVNIIIREPGHVEYASTLGLGVYDRAKTAAWRSLGPLSTLVLLLPLPPCALLAAGHRERAGAAGGIERRRGSHPDRPRRGGTQAVVTPLGVRRARSRDAALPRAKPRCRRQIAPVASDAQPVARRERVALQLARGSPGRECSRATSLPAGKAVAGFAAGRRSPYGADAVLHHRPDAGSEALGRNAA